MFEILYNLITVCYLALNHVDRTKPVLFFLFVSPDLLFSMAEAISLEVRAHWNTVRRDTESNVALGVSCFSPVINIMRHPLWGRNQVGVVVTL